LTNGIPSCPELDTAALRAEVAEARRLNAQFQADNQTLRASRADDDPVLLATVNPRTAMLDDLWARAEELAFEIREQRALLQRMEMIWNDSSKRQLFEVSVAPGRNEAKTELASHNPSNVSEAERSPFNEMRSQGRIVSELRVLHR
jgi:hypothetical protein